MLRRKSVQFIGVFVALFICLVLLRNSLACDDPGKKIPEAGQRAFLLGRMAGYVGLTLLGIKNVEPQQILVLTNAGFARLNNESTAPALDGISWMTEVSIGKGNLIRVQSSRHSPLWFTLFDRRSGEMVYMEADKNVTGEIDEKAFKSKKENISLKRLLGDPHGWDLKVKERVFGGREFSIVMISNQWASGAPYELLQLATFHDHLCPGVTLGYMMAEYLERHLPLGKGEKYYFISLSPSCQDDALQVLFNATVGKKSMTAIPLTQEQSARLNPNAKNISGLYFAWDEKTEKGRGMALYFDWDAMKTKREGLGWLWRLQMSQELLPMLHEPEKVVKEVATFNLPAGKNPASLIGPDLDFLKAIGLIK